jgi:hypothetical protein
MITMPDEETMAARLKATTMVVMEREASRAATQITTINEYYKLLCGCQLPLQDQCCYRSCKKGHEDLIHLGCGITCRRIFRGIRCLRPTLWRYEFCTSSFAYFGVL